MAVPITLLPSGLILQVPEDAPLSDVLFEQGVEFPCGGHGRCKGCRVKVSSSGVPITPADAQRFSPAELSQGWRLSCQLRARGPLSLELAQWSSAVLEDQSTLHVKPAEGLGIAIDLGTTTIAAQLVDLKSGTVLGVRTALNAQAQHGADIMSRIDFAVNRGGHSRLQQLIRNQLRELVLSLLTPQPTPASPVGEIVVVGNAAMHHLFCGLDLTPLSTYPFESSHDGEWRSTVGALGWVDSVSPDSPPALPSSTSIRFLGGLGSFVGSDLTAGILATRMHERHELTLLIDLGTNGEIVLGNRDRFLCASTAAGPAFEGARITHGMRAATGAIAEVHLVGRQLQCRVIGSVPPRGLCGSGLVDAAACALDLGMLQPDGRLPHGNPILLAPPISVSQSDIRELQLAKGAIAAGVRTLLQQWGAAASDVTQVWLAGAFGNYLNRISAQRIGLIEFPPEIVHPVGNTALLGAKLALFLDSYPPESNQHVLRSIRSRSRHVPLNDDPQFMDDFVDSMAFPKASPPP